MKSMSLARVLPVLDSFESQHPRLARLPSLAHDTPRPELHVVEPVHARDIPQPVEDPVVRDQRSWQDGYEDGVAVGRAQAQADVIDRDVLLQDAVAAARADWCTQESERIAFGVERALMHLQGEICSVVTRVLAQISDDAMKDRAINEFCTHVGTLLRDGKAGIVSIHAPNDLIGRLQARLCGFETLEFVAHDRAEVWVRSGATMIETVFESWRSDHFRGV